MSHRFGRRAVILACLGGYIFSALVAGLSTGWTMLLAMREQIVPPTLSLEDPCDGADGVDLVPWNAKERKVEAVLNNSFGFGGTNATVVFRKV